MYFMFSNQVSLYNIVDLKYCFVYIKCKYSIDSLLKSCHHDSKLSLLNFVVHTDTQLKLSFLNFVVYTQTLIDINY